MNAIVQQQFGPLSGVFTGAKTENDLSAGVSAGFGHIGYKGKVWSIRYRGEEKQLMREDGDGPRNSIEVVVLKASGHISKIWYEGKYVEGSTAAPDCFSTNGLTPDMGAAKRQSATCAACPKNAWGSRITEAGKQGKECQDSKRLAIVPLADIQNEVYGGPMLLRVPAASLRDLASFGEKMQALGYPYFSFGIRISFDPAAAYPKFVFGAIRPLNDAEAALVMRMREEPAVDRILAETAPEAPPPAIASPAAAFEQPPQPAPQQVPAPPLAPAAPTSGFGPVGSIQGAQLPHPAPVVAPVTAPHATPQSPSPSVTQPPQATPTPSPAGGATPASPSNAPSSFEMSLDEKLDALLPK